MKFFYLHQRRIIKLASADNLQENAQALQETYVRL